MLKSSLSMILPVYNAQATLQGLVEQALEVLPDLTSRWELLVIDDGSTDATPEIAEDLVRPWPQVSVVHHRQRQGRTGWRRTGVEWSRGEVLLLRDPDCRLDLGGLHKLWKRIVGQDVVVAREAAPASTGRTSVRSATPVREASLLMIRRRALLDWAAGESDEDLPAFLKRRRLTHSEVELRSRTTASSGPRRKTATRGGVVPQHRDPGQDPTRVRQPNYLARLRAFALGE